MHTKSSRPRRAAVTTVAAALVASGTMVALAPAASAATCDTTIGYFCGR